MKRIETSAAGFTLTEVMVASVLMIIMGGAALTLFATTQQTWAQTEASVTATDQARLGVQAIANDLREASAGSLRFPKQSLAGRWMPMQQGDRIRFDGPDGREVAYVVVQPPGATRLSLERRRQVGARTETITVASNLTGLQYMCPTGCRDTRRGQDDPVNFLPLVEIRMTAEQPAALFTSGQRLMQTQFSMQVAVRNL